jgi:Baseplate J-like protein
MAGTLVPTFTFGPAGFTAPSGPAVLTGVQADINAAFGNVLNYDLRTPQGQLAMSWASIIDNTYAAFQFYSQQMDPAYASGRMQDAIGRIYGMQRQPAVPTQLQVSCNGAAGVVIPFGALIQDTLNNLYSCATFGGGTIPAGGSIILQFNAVIPGPTAVPATNGISIYQAIPGWDSVTVSSGTIGQNIEGRSAFEIRRQASVAGNSFGAIGSIIGAVSLVPNVTDFFGINNNNSTTLNTLGVSIPPYAIYISVAGGDPTAIAQAILSKKGAGAPMAGNTTVTVYDSNPLYSSPIPYQITFEVPSPVNVLWNVVLVNNPLIPPDATTQVQNAIIAAATGQSALTNPPPRIRIGSLVYAQNYVSAISALGSWAQVSLIQIGTINNAGSVNFGATISGQTMTVLTGTITGGSIAVGQFVEDPRIVNGTYITGGSGLSWQINNPQTLTTMTATANTSGASTTVTLSGLTGGTIVTEQSGGGDVITGGTIPTNTTIVSQTSGTVGGNGVYVVSTPITCSGTAVTIYPGLMGATAASTSTQINANQVPQITAPNILVSHT